MDPFSCAVERRSDAAIVDVQGEVDVASAPGLREVLIGVLAETPTTHLIVDLSRVAFIDSTGIGVLVGAHNRTITKGGRVTVVVTTAVVRRVLHVTGLLPVLHVTASVEEALED